MYCTVNELYIIKIRSNAESSRINSIELCDKLLKMKVLLTLSLTLISDPKVSNK